MDIKIRYYRSVFIVVLSIQDRRRTVGLLGEARMVLPLSCRRNYLYKELLNIVKDKDYFVITTNVDGQFLKAGFEPNRLFYTQGDYCYFQDSTGDDRNLYYNETKVRQMLANTANDLHIPTSMIPLDPVNGHGMAVNLRCDNTFVEDDNWHAMCSRYENFVRKACNDKLVLLEFGLGSTPLQSFDSRLSKWLLIFLTRHSYVSTRTIHILRRAVHGSSSVSMKASIQSYCVNYKSR